jgi:hypothetical protein
MSRTRLIGRRIFQSMDTPGRFPRRDNGSMSDAQPAAADFCCPNCAQPVPVPLLCGDCGALLCRTCGKPVERIDELGIG